MDWVSGRAVKVESERSQWWSPVVQLQRSTMDLGWKLIVIHHLVSNLGANVINIENKESELPSGYMLVYKDQAVQEEGLLDHLNEKDNAAVLSRRQDSYQESLDVLHSPRAPPKQTLGNHQHQRGGAPHPLANRPRWDVPGRLGGSHGWSGEDLQRVDWGQREPQRRVGLNLEPVLAPKNFTVAGQEVKDTSLPCYRYSLHCQTSTAVNILNKCLNQTFGLQVSLQPPVLLGHFLSKMFEFVTFAATNLAGQIF